MMSLPSYFDCFLNKSNLMMRLPFQRPINPADFILPSFKICYDSKVVNYPRSLAAFFILALYFLVFLL